MRKSRLIIILAAVAVVACAAVIFFVTRNGSGQETTGSSVGRPEMLPDYCRTEVSRVAREITAQSEEGDVIFGLFTDTHFAGGEIEKSEKRKEKRRALHALPGRRCVA